MHMISIVIMHKIKGGKIAIMHKISEETTSQYRNRFAKEKYDRLNIQVPKGKKELIEAYRTEKGYKSLNEYINSIIDADMNNELGGGNNR